MATTPLPNLKPIIVYSPIPSSISFPKIPFHVSSKPFRSLSSSSRSRHGSFAVTCSNNNGNAKPNSERMKSDFGLNNLLSGFVEDLLNIEEIDNLMSGFVDELEKSVDHRFLVEMLSNATQKLAERETEIKKMKQTINQLQTRAAQIEKCREKLLEIKAVVEEAERSLFKL